MEEAAATLGASPLADLPPGDLSRILIPALLTGFALAFARAIGEYGSVVFIAGNMPMVSEITPLIIITKLEQYDYAGATAIAAVMLVAVVRSALAINALQGGRVDARARIALRQIRMLERTRPVCGIDRSAAGWPATGRVRHSCACCSVGLALTFLTLFLFAPLAVVFVQALRKGIGVYLAAITDPDAVDAIRLTLLVAAIAVPLNLAFGIAAAWAIAKFTFPGKSVLITLIDLPFSVSPVISGLIYVLMFGLQGWFGAVARRRTTSRSSSPCPASCWRRSSSRFRSSPAKLIPLMQAQGTEEEEAATCARRQRLADVLSA